jgi:hypothetical protein
MASHEAFDGFISVEEPIRSEKERKASCNCGGAD